MTGVGLQKILDPTVTESVPLGDVGGGVQEQLVVPALINTSGVLNTGLGQQSCCQVDTLAIVIQLMYRCIVLDGSLPGTPPRGP